MAATNSLRRPITFFGDRIAKGRELVSAAQDALARGLLGYAVVIASRPVTVALRERWISVSGKNVS